mmetsp:Transcript_21863/g.39875  ORF Transcript_21863/g.39875 Transcript_21863/m.39875 type:complete len:164 (+) Transcript_21863:115-606(+)
MFCGGAITGSGDFIAQRILEGNSSLDMWRFANITSYGFFVGGFLGHFWFRWLDIAFGRRSSVKSAFNKTIVDQLISTPPEILCFFIWASYGKGKDSKEPENKSAGDYFRVLSANYLIWIPLQGLNFLIVPERHRVLFNNVAGVLWTSLLSFAVHNPLAKYWPV